MNNALYLMPIRKSTIKKSFGLYRSKLFFLKQWTIIQPTGKPYDYQTKQAKKRIKTLHFHRSNPLGFPLSKIIFPGPRRFLG